MAKLRAWVCLCTLAVLAGGCAPHGGNLFKASHTRGGEKALSAGIKYYDAGNYGDAAVRLREALRKGLDSTSDRVKAHKYLAFSYCLTDQRKRCSGEFREVLKIDPDFDLPPAEAGHPIWGPVFRSVKTNMPRP